MQNSLSIRFDTEIYNAQWVRRTGLVNVSVMCQRSVFHDYKHHECQIDDSQGLKTTTPQEVMRTSRLLDMRWLKIYLKPYAVLKNEWVYPRSSDL